MHLNVKGCASRETFQSRNRGSFDFKAVILRCTLSTERTFQSRNRGSFDFKFLQTSLATGGTRFQSRNRGSFDFKFSTGTFWKASVFSFQSRNRGSFDFKDFEKLETFRIYKYCFNLVIEVLLISRYSLTPVQSVYWRFNLVIEVLLISSQPFSLYKTRLVSFNLVIEVLLISRLGFWRKPPLIGLFQSRNRGSFDFKNNTTA